MGAQNLYLGRRAFGGQVARAGESGIVTVSYVNTGDTVINGGYFVAKSERGCKGLSSATDRVLGVAVVMGVHHEFKPNRNLSVMAIPHGSEVWVHMTPDSTLADGDAVKIVATGEYAGAISHEGGIETQFYVTSVLGDLAKIMRSEVSATTQTPAA